MRMSMNMVLSSLKDDVEIKLYNVKEIVRYIYIERIRYVPKNISDYFKSIAKSLDYIQNQQRLRSISKSTITETTNPDWLFMTGKSQEPDSTIYEMLSSVRTLWELDDRGCIGREDVVETIKDMENYVRLLREEYVII